MTLDANPSGGVPPYTFLWDTGAVTQTITVTPPADTQYTVTVTDADVCTVSSSETVMIAPALTANTAGSPPTAPLNLPASFVGGVIGGVQPFNSFAWDFGDGVGTSTVQNPTYIYTVLGTYTVTFTVTDFCGTPATALPLTVDVVDCPVFTVTATVTAPTVCAESDCTDDVDNDADGQTDEFETIVGASESFAGIISGTGTQPYSLLWDFGDFSTSTAQNPSHTYSAAGTYTVTFTVTDACPFTATDTITVIVCAGGLTATAAGPASATPSTSVSFNGTVSGGTLPYSYAWDFGDGVGTSTVEDPTYAAGYAAVGTYTVTLTVTDACGVTATGSFPITIATGLIATPTGPTLTAVGVSNFFVGAASGGIPPYSFAWDFGDGVGTSALQNPSYTYTAAGTYTVTLTVTDNGGGTASGTLIVTVCSAALVITADTNDGVKLAVQGEQRGFNATVLSGALPITSFAWGFGDGGTSALEDPTYMYTVAGTYTVTLTVTDSCGQVKTDSFGITVCTSVFVITADTIPSSVPAATATMNVPKGFSGTATGGVVPYTFQWNFGDGGTITVKGGSVEDVIYTYLTGGTYTVTLMVTDVCGVIAINSFPITVACAGGAPVAVATGPSVITVGTPESFTGAASGGTPPYSFAWAFGDGVGTSAAQNPNYTYTMAGTFAVTLTVTDSCGATGIDSSLTVTVCATALTVTADTQDGFKTAIKDVPRDFSGTISGVPPYTILWDFGDGGTSALQNPSYTYTTAGIYTVTLTVTDSCGLTDTDSFIITVCSGGLTITADTQDGFKTATVNAPRVFLGTASGGVSPYSFAWSFGDGGTSATKYPVHTYTAAGTFTVTLKVTDSCGVFTTVFFDIIACPGVALTATATGLSVTTVGTLVSFTGGASGGAPTYGYAWDFGDGVGTSTMQNPTYTYAATNTYPVTLTVTDACGVTDTDSFPITVCASALTATATGPATNTATVGASELFTAATSGGAPPFTYAWDFGDGNTSAIQNPTYTYSTAGTYTVTLTVTDSCSLTDTDSLSIIVCDSGSVVATANGPSFTVVGTAESFTGSATGGSAPYDYAWDFGDTVGTSAVQNPTYTYTVAGTYTVALTVADACGNSSALVSFPITVCASALTVTADTNDGAKIAVQNEPRGFNGTISGTSPYTILWNFGDGNTSAIEDPTHPGYATEGIYTVTLTVTDTCGLTETDSFDITVCTSGITITATGPAAATVNIPETFSGTVTGGILPYTFQWDFGDGETITVVGGAVEDVIYTYLTGGNFTVTLKVTDSCGVFTTDFLNVTGDITVCPDITLAATADTEDGAKTADVNVLRAFSGTVSGGVLPYTGFAWNFGDGVGTSTAQNPTYTYTAPGTYTVTFTVTDTCGAADADSFSIVVSCPILTATATGPATATVGKAEIFTGTASGGTPAFTYAWVFGDGVGTSTAQNPSYIYSASATYIVTLTVTDACGATDTDSFSVIVSCPALTALAIGPASTTVGTAESFTGAGTFGTPSYTSFSWSFGDGGISTAQNPTYTYTAAATYTVTLAVTDSCGLTDTDSFDIVVCAVSVVTATAKGPSITVVGTAESFTSSATGGTTPYNFAWDFDDGSTSTAQNPTYTYPLAGIYTVTLTAIDSCGNTSAPVSFTVTVCASALTVTADTNDGAKIAIENESRGFNGTISGTPPYTILWNFGDGGTSALEDPTYAYAAAGNYTVTLTVDDTCGLTETDSFDIIVCTSGITITATGPATATVSIPESFSGTVTGGVVPYTFQWDFGDGGAITVVGGAAEDVIYTYLTGGNYTVTLKVTDTCGVFTTDSFDITVCPGTTPAAAADTDDGVKTAAVNVSRNFSGTASEGVLPYTGFAWDFGDGVGASTAQNPTYTYTKAGTYTVALTVTDTCGATDTDSFSIVVSCPALTATATGPVTATVGTTESFTGAASGGTPAFTYAWDFGNGVGTSTAQNPSYAYPAPGTFTVTLTVDDACGATDSDSFSISVSCPALTATATGPAATTVGTTENFTGATAGGTPAFTYAWDFGNGVGTSTAQSPSYAYPAPGTFTVTLTVTDTCGLTETDSFDVLVCGAGPVVATAAVSALCGESDCTDSVDNNTDGNTDEFLAVAGVAESFTGSATGGSTPYSYAWAFGDGGTSTAQNPNYTYLLAGVYTVSLIATDACGNASAADTFLIEICASALSITADTNDGIKIAVKGEIRDFDAIFDLAAPGSPPYDFDWDFGNGDKISVKAGAAVDGDVPYTYLVEGAYTVTLTVGDKCGLTDTDSFDITVCTSALSIFAETLDGTNEAAKSVPESFRGTVLASGVPPYTYQWDFGDGGTITVVGGAVEDVIYTYTCFGLFPVTLTVIDACGVLTWVDFPVTVLGGTALSATAVIPSPFTVDELATFIGDATGGNHPPVPAITYEWDFDDGGKATGKVVQHTYTVAGNWDVTLTVTDECGAKYIYSESTTSVCPAVTATVSGPALPTVGTPESFTGSASGGSAPFSYDWDFGDGGTSTVQSPTYTYAKAGPYTVTLTVTDSCAPTSETDTDSLSINVSCPALTATATGPAATTVGTLESFTGAAAGGTPAFTYAWDFGDGGTDTAQSPSYTYLTPGTFTVTFTVNDSCGATDTDSFDVLVCGAGPVVATAGGPSIAVVSVAESFTGSAAGGSTPYSFAWAFGDGGTSTAQNPTYTYPVGGSYTVSLTATDACGVFIEDSFSICVVGGLSNAVIEDIDTSPVCDGETITFTAQAATGGATPYTYQWDFTDDGVFDATDQTSAPPPAVTNVYAAPGTYTVRLRITDSCAQIAETTGTVTVNPYPTAVITPSGPTTFCSDGGSVDLVASSAAGTPPFTYLWTPGGETTATITVTASGTYSVTITGAAPSLCADTSAGEVVTVNVTPTAAPTVDVDPVCQGTVQTFTANNVGGDTFSWDFGNGDTSAVQNPTYTYPAAGNWTARVMVIDSVTLCTSGWVQVAGNPVVVNPYPTAVITPSGPTTFCSDGGSVDLVASSAAGTPPFTYLWTPGGETTATITVTASGTYSVTITGAAPSLCADTSAGEVVTVNTNPTAAPTVDLNPVALGTLQTFTANNVGGDTFQWIFDDGGTSWQQNPTHTYLLAGSYTVRLLVTDSVTLCTSGPLEVAGNPVVVNP